MIDLLEGKNREVKVGKHGLVFLTDSMPRLVNPGETGDHAILRAARTTTGIGDKPSDAQTDRGLIRYLMRHSHTTPVEFVVFQFYIALPIFVARQLVRHRMATLNEFSLRYSNPKDQCHVPEPTDIRKQSKTNRQGTEGQVEEGTALEFCEVTQETFDAAYKQYERDIGNGIGREQARWNLPLSTMTFWSWKIDLHNLFRTLSLRMDKHAQKEIQDFGVALHELTKELAPWAFEAWQDFDQRRDALLLTGPEVEYLVFLNTSVNMNATYLNLRVTMREQEEFVVKLRRIGLIIQAAKLENWIHDEKLRLKLEREKAKS